MNLLILLPFALLIVPFIPTIIEIFKRKDRGPREVPEQTTYEELPNLEIPRLERARGDARARIVGDVIRVTGNVSIPEGTEIKNHLMVQGNLKIGRESHVYGSIKAFGDIDLGESTIVEGHVLSEGTVTVGRNCTVKGIVDSLKDIILEENSVVEAVSTERTVKVGPNAKINRRILSGASIVTLPPSPAKEKERGEETSPITVPGLSKETGGETPSITDNIFQHLEERIKMFEKVKTFQIESEGLEGLTPLEDKVLKAAYNCRSKEEICLRLMMDPSEVDEVINSLMEKGYLDEDLKPKIPPATRRIEESAPPKDWQEETLLGKEMIERLIASKMREELKRRIEKLEEGSEAKQKPNSSEATNLQKGSQHEVKDILKEWKKSSSLLWGEKTKKDRESL